MYSILRDIPFGSHLSISCKDGIYAQTENTTTTWGDVFAFLQSAHFHAEAGRTTPHAESLWDHLVRCGEQSYAKAVALGYTAHEAKKAYFAGFLHDLGKPACLTRSRTHLAFKGHGLVGGAILENAWTPQLGAALQFSSEDWADISTLADVHMCGYFPHQTTHQHAVGFQILPATVKRLLPCLRWGDMAAMESTDPTLFPSDPAPDEARFMATLLESLDIQRIAKEHPRGILIQLCGASGTGKTTLATWLKEQFGNRNCIAHIITRDFYTVQETMRQLGTPWDGLVTPAIYREAYAHYVSTNKAYASEINSAMKRDIQTALQQGHIVILDTLMNMYPQTLKSILPECVAQAFQLNLWVHRNTVFTEEETKGRLGMTLAEQLEIHGETGAHWNPFLKRLQWAGLVSSTE
jgi:hypothetical protein